MIDFECEFEYQYNLEILGEFLNENFENLSIPSFEKFLFQRNAPIQKPKKPHRPIVSIGQEFKQIIFDEAYRQAILHYNNYLKDYETAVFFQEKMKQFEPTKSGYADYLAKNFENITPFLNGKNKIPISEANRRLHTYITGGSGSGKSEAIKSLIWHYLTQDTRTGLILLSPNGF